MNVKKTKSSKKIVLNFYYVHDIRFPSVDFTLSFVDSDNLPEAIGSGNLGTSRTRKTCESSAHWECRG